jgi:hypothetical protein
VVLVRRVLVLLRIDQHRVDASTVVAAPSTAVVIAVVNAFVVVIVA